MRRAGGRPQIGSLPPRCFLHGVQLRGMIRQLQWYPERTGDPALRRSAKLRASTAVEVPSEAAVQSRRPPGVCVLESRPPTGEAHDFRTCGKAWKIRLSGAHAAASHGARLPPDTHGARLRTVRKRLSDLQRVLMEMPAEMRRQHIRALQAGTQAALLGFMEKQRELVAGPAIAGNVLPTSSEWPIATPTGCSALPEELNWPFASLPGSCPTLVPRGAPRISAKGIAGVAMAATGVGMQRSRSGCWRAKVHIGNLCIYGAFTSLDKAQGDRDFFTSIRKAVASRMQALNGGGLPSLHAGANDTAPDRNFCANDETCFRQEEDRLRIVLLEVLAEHQRPATPKEESTTPLKAYVMLHVSRWLGSVHVSSPRLPVDEALQVRQELLVAKKVGWPAFRGTWVKLMQHAGHPPRIRRQPRADFSFRTFIRGFRIFIVGN